MSAVLLNMNAWREVLARTFEGTTAQHNVSPDWLVNPATRRRLKLDCYYPEVGVAVRFIGLVSKGQPRQSDWEILEEQQRDEIRAELCRLNDVQLALIDPLEDPVKQTDTFLRVLSRAARLTAQGHQPPNSRRSRMDSLSHANRRAGRLRRAIAADPEQMMAILAEAWRDREASLVTATQQAGVVAAERRGVQQNTDPAAYAPGQRVQHSRFGPGVITTICDDGDDTRISIRFDNEQERTFLANRLGDNLSVVRGS